MKQTYGQLWDGYVAESFPKLQQDNAKLSYPGEEWGNEASWQRIFDKLFVPAGVSGWDAALEIGGGGGKYTESVLRANDKSRVFGFDVSVNFLEATGKRLSNFVDGGRLSLHEIDSTHPDAMLTMVEAAGYARRVDAMFSIDAMVHVDLQYLTTYWVNAALLLKPGGRVLMTLADPTTVSGFQKILRDIRKFYKFQGRICPKFEYLSHEIVTRVLTTLGFEIEVLEPWSYHDGRPARDLYLIARLANTDHAERLRALLRADPLASVPPNHEKPESFADLWTREAARAIAGANPDRPGADLVRDHLFARAGLATWRNVVEIGGGDARYTDAVLRANPAVKITGYDVSRPVMDAAAAKLAPDVAAGRLEYRAVDAVHPDAIFKAFERDGLKRQVDAVFSIDAMLHVDLQYQLSYYVNAAMLLREGGHLVIQVADATSPTGLARLLSDIRVFFAFQGQACPRFEWQSPQMMRALLGALGFDIVAMGNWNPATNGADGRDLFIIARMPRPKDADALRAHVSIGLPIPTLNLTSDTPQEDDNPEGPNDAENEIARALGQAYWRQLTIQANPDLTKEQLRDQMAEAWGGNRREYTKLGRMVMRQMASMGFNIVKSGKG